MHFKLREEAQMAKDNLNGTILGSKSLYVEWNQMLPRSGNRSSFRMHAGFQGGFDMGPVISIYVQFETVEVIREY